MGFLYEAGKFFGSDGSLVYAIPISLKILTASSYSLLILIAPCSVWLTLQLRAHNSLMGQSWPQVKPRGLSERMTFAAPYQFLFSIL